MNEFIDRQIAQLANLSQLYEEGKISLNQFVSKSEGLLALSEMELIRKKVGNRIDVIEEINAYLLDGGNLTDEIKAEINLYIKDIKIIIQKR